MFIGAVEIIGLFVEKFGLGGALWTEVASLNSSLGNFGILVIGLFALSWLVSYGLFQWRGGENPKAMRLD
jgi:nickel/cobalt transporter (NiCoT) family protein